MNNDEKRAKVIECIDDLYGDGGNAVIMMVTDYLTDDDWANLYDRLEHDGAFSETEPEQLSFDELVSELTYWFPKNNTKKTIRDIREECREFIRNSGFVCLDDSFDADDAAKEWFEENHPEFDITNMETTSVLYEPREILCMDLYSDDAVFGELRIEFYGDWDKHIGVFNVAD